jgi:hypothetical protein
MIEFTLTEMILFAWGIGATACAFKFHEDRTMARFFLQQIITDKDVRDKIVGAYQKHTEKQA